MKSLTSLLLILAFCPLLSTRADEYLLHTLAEIRSINKCASNISFDVVGQVISKYTTIKSSGRRPEIVLIDGAHRIAISDLAETNRCAVGDLVRVFGFVNRGQAASINGIFASKIIRLGHEDLPLPATPADDSNPVLQPEISPFSTRGVITDVFPDELSSYFIWITLETLAGPVNAIASVDEYAALHLEGLIDAEVEIRGIRKFEPFFRWQTTSNVIQLYGTNGIQVIQHAPNNPRLAPEFPSDGFHRQRTTGIVQGKTRSSVFLATSSKNLITVHLSGSTRDFAIGDTVTVAGFPVIHRYGTSFANAIACKDTRLKDCPVPPIPVTGKQLANDPAGRESVNYRYHGKLLTLEGELRSDDNETATTGILRLDCDDQEVQVDLSGLDNQHRQRFKRGSILRITGICIVEFENRSAKIGLPRFRRYLLVPRSLDDIMLIARPRGWVTGALLIIIAILVSIVIAISIWTKSLKVLSEKRGHALSSALTARVRAESRTQERTRLALELHDSISQTLTGVALQIDAATTTVQIDDRRRNAYLMTAKHLLASCQKALQDCLWDLRSRTFEEKNLTEAIFRTLAPFQDKCAILVRFNVPREALSESATHAVLSIVRELTANAIRHGHASHIRIAGELRDGAARFSVTDNGCGFDPEHAPGPHAGHFGLQGIRERINDFNGTVNLTSAPGTGTKVTASLVLDPSENHHEEKRA